MVEPSDQECHEQIPLPLSSLKYNLERGHLPEVLILLNGDIENKNSTVSLAEKSILLQAFSHKYPLVHTERTKLPRAGQ